MIITDSESLSLSPKTKKELILDALKKPKLGVVIDSSKKVTNLSAVVEH